MPAAKNKKSRPLARRPLAICLGGILDGDLVPANPDPAFPPPGGRSAGYRYKLFKHEDGSVISAYIAASVTDEAAAGFLGEAFAKDGRLVEVLIRRP